VAALHLGAEHHSSRLQNNSVAAATIHADCERSSRNPGRRLLHVLSAMTDGRPGQVERDRDSTASPAPARHRSIEEPGEVTVLYIEFPDVVLRWEADEVRTSADVRRAHAWFASVIALHGGTAIPAHLDARSALFVSSRQALSAAMALARDAKHCTPLPASIGLATGSGYASGTTDIRTFNHARALADIAGSCGIVLDAITARAVAGALPTGVMVHELGLVRHPELGTIECPARLLLFDVDHARQTQSSSAARAISTFWRQLKFDRKR
jgi:hypothetical protein